jgi:TolB-like protein
MSNVRLMGKGRGSQAAGRAILWIRLALALALSTARPASALGQQETFERAVAGAAETVAGRLSGMTVAVFDFPDLEGRVSNLSRLVSEEFTTGLVQHVASGGAVVERRQVDQVLAELELQKTDLTAEEVSRAGRQLGADAIVTGTTVVLGQQIVINVRAVDVARGRVLAAARVTVRGTRELLSMGNQGHDGPTFAPQRPNTGQGASTTTTSSSPAPTTPDAPQPRTDSPLIQRVGRVTLTLQSCGQTGDGIRCDFLVTAARNERFSIVWMGLPPDGPITRNRVIDSGGNQHRATEIGIGGNLRNFGNASTELVASIPIRASVQFTGVEEEHLLPLVEVQVWVDESYHTVQFRDVQVRS